MAKIIKVEQTVPTIKTKKKVAAYARVSMESERMNHSPLRTNQLLQHTHSEKPRLAVRWGVRRRRNFRHEHRET